MRYIWQNYDAENDFYVDTKPFSPYLEVSYTGAKKIGVNPCIRFYEIFSPFYNGVVDDFEQIEDLDSLKYSEPLEESEPLSNCLFHYLAMLDLKSGMHLTSMHECKLDEEICNGVYGDKVREIYLALNENERRIILIYLQRHDAAQGLQTFFFDAVLQFFPAAKFYFYEWEKKFLFCIPAACTEHNETLMELLIFFLFDMGANYEIFWNRHFGIIGDAKTMRLDSTVIY